MRDALLQERARWLQKAGLLADRVTAVKQTVGTDCSGLDCCIFGLRKMQIHHQHLLLEQKCICFLLSSLNYKF